MTSTGSSNDENKSPLAAAQKIVAALENVKKEDQLLSLQLAMQALRLTPAPIEAPARVSQTPPSNSRGDAPPSPQTRATDIKSFTESKAPQSDQQFAAVVAYFHLIEAPESQRRSAIDADTMKDAARLAKWGQVRDWNKTLNNATGAGYLDRAERGTFKLSAVGENLVAITLPGSVWGGAGGAKKQGKRTSKKSDEKKKASTKSR